MTCDSYVVVCTNNTNRGVKHLQTNKQTFRNGECQLQKTFTKHDKYVVNQNPEHVDNGSNGENVFAL